MGFWFDGSLGASQRFFNREVADADLSGEWKQAGWKGRNQKLGGLEAAEASRWEMTGSLLARDGVVA